jgi:hypothetical protein
MKFGISFSETFVLFVPHSKIVALGMSSRRIGTRIRHTGVGRYPGGADRMIGVGGGLRRPRPPNRACGFPAHGSPVGSFLIGIGSLTHGP